MIIHRISTVMAGLICLLPAFASAQAKRSAKKPPSWDIKEERDAITDSVTTIATLDSPNVVRAIIGSDHPTLRIDCGLVDKQRKLRLVFWTGAPANADKMTLRFDKNDAFDVSTERSSDLKWQFVWDGQRDTVLAELAKAKTLLVRYTPYVSGSVDFSFDLTGIEKVFAAMHRAGCGKEE